MACLHKKKLWDNRWCPVTCFYCTGEQERTCKHNKATNADRIRAMNDEELAKEMLFFCPTDTVFRGEDTYGKPHYAGLDGGYYATSEEVVASNLEWLKQPAE